MLQITGQLSCFKPRLRRYLSFDYFHQKETKPTDKASSRVSLRHLYYSTWKKNELVWLIPVTATVKSWSQMLLLARNENWWQGHKINKPVYSLRLSSKLHICHSKLRFSAKYSFLGQYLSRAYYQPMYQPPEGVYLLNIPSIKLLDNQERFVGFIANFGHRHLSIELDKWFVQKLAIQFAEVNIANVFT